MQYKDNNENLEKFIDIQMKNKELMEMLEFVSRLKLPNYYIAAGSIFQTIWNYYDGEDLNFGIKDIDVIYYNKEDLSIEKDLEYYNIIKNYAKKKGFEYDIDVSNEARMHLWSKKHENKDVKQYESSEDAISKWIATIHAVGITKENNKIKVYAPYGLSDIYTRTIRPIKHENNSKEKYNNKVLDWSKRFNNLNIIEW